MKKISPLLILLLIASASHGGMKWGRGGKCQILDQDPASLYTLSGAYLEESDIESGSDTGIFEVNAGWGIAYWHDTLGGDIDLHVNLGTTFFLQTASLDLPESVTELSLDLAWIHRMRNGWSLIVGLTPGIYSDFETLEGDGFFLPVRVAGVKTFSPTVSGIAGLEYRSGFDRELFPLIGLAWEPDQAFRLELGLPQSVIVWRPDDIWEIYGKFTWRNTTYDLRERVNDSRENLTLEDYRNAIGIKWMADDRVAFLVEAGKVYHRSLVFERRNASTVELEMSHGMLVKGGIAGYF